MDAPRRRHAKRTHSSNFASLEQLESPPTASPRPNRHRTVRLQSRQVPDATSPMLLVYNRTQHQFGNQKVPIVTHSNSIGLSPQSVHSNVPR